MADWAARVLYPSRSRVDIALRLAAMRTEFRLAKAASLISYRQEQVLAYTANEVYAMPNRLSFQKFSHYFLAFLHGSSKVIRVAKVIP